jgi:long-chain acyl-CoA synthetase
MEIGSMAKSIYELFQNTVKTRGDRVAAQYKVAGAWRDVTWNEMRAISEKVSAGLAALGVQKNDRVSIVSETRIEWVLADVGILGAGAATVPIYHSNTADDCEFILGDAGSVIAFVEDKEQVEKLRSIREQIPNVKKIICFAAGETDKDSDWEIEWDDFLAEGEAYLKDHAEEIKARGESLGPDDLLTLIYTSGTTGRPKGTILTHDCMLYEAEIMNQVGLIGADDLQYLFLPLAHVFAKVIEIGWFATGHIVAFWEKDQKKIVTNLAEVRPTMMGAVPRIYEKVHAAVIDKVNNAPGPKGALARWAIRKGQEAAELEKSGKTPGGLGWTLAQKLVWSKLQADLSEKFGGRLRFFISGGAPLSTDIAYFFKFAGVKICEGYGLTETSAATCINLPDTIQIGSVGQVVPGTEVKIAEDGEILIRGRGVMKGYWNREDATKEAINEDGWFYSGDIGSFDKDGNLRITDRKKDIIVTAGGKNVAPQNLENSLKSKSPLISQVVIHGDKRKFLSALITIDPEALENWSNKTSANANFSYSKTTQSEGLNAAIQDVVNDLNQGLASYETLKKFKILDHDFEIGEQLTPTLKVKRKLCNERYKDQFDSMYA